MRQAQLFRYALIGFLILLIWLAFLLLRPYLTYIILGLMLTYLLHPLYRRLQRKMKRPYFASTLMVLFVILVLVIPFTLLASKLVVESRAAYRSLQAFEVPEEVDDLAGRLGLDLNRAVDEAATRVRDFFVSSVPDIIGGFVDALFGLFVMFLIMLYAFPEGNKWVRLVREGLPLEHRHRKQLIERVGDVTAAVMYGQFLTALIQGAAGGIMLWLFGVPNPLFLGVIMVITSVIPVLGSYIVWLPIALWQLANGHWISGIGILAVGSIIIGNLDNFVKPYLIGSQAKLSTLLVLLGVLGGLQLFGLIGIVLGPLLLALLQTVIGFLREDPGIA